MTFDVSGYSGGSVPDSHRLPLAVSRHPVRGSFGSRQVSRRGRAFNSVGWHACRVTTVSFRFYAGLNDFLPPDRRGKRFELRVDGRPAYKDTIESLGVPHPEVDLILVGGGPVGFGETVRDGDCVSVYPRFCEIDPGALGLAPPVPSPPRFVLDVHLGRLAAYLRALGFDTLYERYADDADLAGLSSADDRVLLTRDIGLLKRKNVALGYWLRSKQPREQLREIALQFGLAEWADPFTRCLHDNAPLESVAKRDIDARLEPGTRARHHRFWRCTRCDRLYWEGSHHARMQQFFAALVGVPCESR